MCQEILQYYWNISNIRIGNTIFYRFVMDKILLVPLIFDSGGRARTTFYDDSCVKGYTINFRALVKGHPQINI